MNFLNGLQHILRFINDNLVTIIVVIGLIFVFLKKIKKYLSESDDEKVKIAKRQITEIMLKIITDAEIDFESYNKAGSIKRSQVIKEIFKEYPILSKVSNQDEVIQFIDIAINDSLKELRKTIEVDRSNRIKV